MLLNRSLQDVSEGLFIDSAELLAQRRRNKKRKIIKTPHEQCSADIRIEPEIDISIELLQSKCA